MRHFGNFWPLLCLACLFLCLGVADAVEEDHRLVKPQEEDALGDDLLVAPFTTTPPLREDAHANDDLPSQGTLHPLGDVREDYDPPLSTSPPA